MMFTPCPLQASQRVEGKLSCFVAACFGFDGLGEDFADGVEYAGRIQIYRWHSLSRYRSRLTEYDGKGTAKDKYSP